MCSPYCSPARPRPPPPLPPPAAFPVFPQEELGGAGSGPPPKAVPCQAPSSLRPLGQVMSILTVWLKASVRRLSCPPCRWEVRLRGSGPCSSQGAQAGLGLMSRRPETSHGGIQSTHPRAKHLVLLTVCHVTGETPPLPPTWGGGRGDKSRQPCKPTSSATLVAPQVSSWHSQRAGCRWAWASLSYKAPLARTLA